MRVAWIVALAGCLPEPEGPPLEDWCAGVWPRDGVAPDLQVWADGYLLYLEESWGEDEAFVRDHVAILGVEVWGIPTEHATVHARFSFDWVRFVVSATADHEGRPPTALAAAGAFEPWYVPQIDPRAAPRPWAEVEGALASCEAELGVDFPDTGWCSTYVTFDPLDDDQAGVRFDHRVELGTGRLAEAHLYAWGHEPDTCREVRIVSD